MNIGRMKTRLELQKEEGDVDSFGEKTSVWHTRAVIWGEWKEEVGGVTVTTRYYPGVSTCGWRLKLAKCCETDSDRYFGIATAIDPDGSKRTLVITAQELS